MKKEKVIMQVLKDFGNLSGQARGIGNLEEAHIQAVGIQKGASGSPDINGKMPKTAV